ncbi:transposase [Kocuria rhizosphaericola]|uniref:transposase n=1 Tax=Kocuria rhizosphaericola TaxID=3376284 RepID=UPI003F885F42
MPPDQDFATKPELAATMLERAVAAHVPAAWVTTDTVDCQVWAFRRAVGETGLHYVLEVPASQAVWPKAGPLACHQVRAWQPIASLPGRPWWVLEAGGGAKGQRRSFWAQVRVRVIGIFDFEGEYWLLARRSLMDPTELAYYLCFAPPKVSRAELVRIAGTR